MTVGAPSVKWRFGCLDWPPTPIPLADMENQVSWTTPGRLVLQLQRFDPQKRRQVGESTTLLRVPDTESARLLLPSLDRCDHQTTAIACQPPHTQLCGFVVRMFVVRLEPFCSSA